MKFNILFSVLLIIPALYAQNESAGRFSGLVYADYFYNAARDTGFNSLSNTAIKGQQDIHGFDLRRIYFTYDYKISSDFSSRFRLESDGKTISEKSKFSAFVKDAYIKWKNIAPGQEVIFGIQPTPAYDKSEAFYGYRSLEKTIMDLRGIVSSRDFGLSLKGKITDAMGYWIMYANNSTSPESDKYKRVYAHLNYMFPANIEFSVYGDMQFREKISTATGELSNNSITTAVYLGYEPLDCLKIGTEVFYQTTENDVMINNIADDRNALGLSVFSSIKLHEKATFTARYDLFDPGLNSELQHDKRNMFIFGLSYTPVDDVAIIPNIMIESYEELESRSVDASVTPRITVAYNFN